MSKATETSNWQIQDRPDPQTNKLIVAALVADESRSAIADSSGRYYTILCPTEDGVHWDLEEPIEGEGPYAPEAILAWFELKPSQEKWQPVSTSPLEVVRSETFDATYAKEPQSGAETFDSFWRNHRLLAKLSTTLMSTGQPCDDIKVVAYDKPEYGSAGWLDYHAEPLELNEYECWTAFRLPA
jgi:hypothetical protein